MSEVFSESEKKVFAVLVKKSNKALIEATAAELELPVETVYKIFKRGWQSCQAKVLFEAEANFWKNKVANHQKFLGVIHSMFKFIKDNENGESFHSPEECTDAERDISLV